MQKTYIACVLGLALGLAAQAQAFDAKKPHIVIGTTVGDFGDMVKFSIKPQLEQQGYKVTLREFTDYVRPNLALAEGSLDVNVFQHRPYLDQFKKEHKLAIAPMFQVPTAPLGLYAGRLKAVSQVKEGVTIAVPNDPSNFARALVMLKDMGWVELKPNVNPLTASTHDIAKNIKNVRLIQLEAAQLPRARQDADFAIINGNYATNAGIKLTEILVPEKSYAYVNWGVIRTADANQPWTKDVVAAYDSPAFKSWAQKQLAGYQLPQSWKK